MAELLVRLYDKYTGDDLIDAATFLYRGDVVVAQDDGWEWSKAERESPDWIIIKIPGISSGKVSALLSPEQGERFFNRLLHKRQFHLDLDALAVAGYPIPSEKEARDAHFPITPEGLDKVASGSTDPVGAIMTEISAGQRYYNREAKLASDIVEIKEADFDKAKREKRPRVDPGIIDNGMDPSVIG